MTIKILRTHEAEHIRQILRVPRESPSEEPLAIFIEAKNFRSVAAYLSKTVHTFTYFRDTSFELEGINPIDGECFAVTVTPNGQIHAHSHEWDIEAGRLTLRPPIDLTEFNPLFQLQAIRETMLPILSLLAKNTLS